MITQIHTKSKSSSKPNLNESQLIIIKNVISVVNQKGKKLCLCHNMSSEKVVFLLVILYTNLGH